MLMAFNNSQLEILKVLEHLKGEKDLAEIKSLLIAYLSDKVVRNADAAFDEKKYTAEVFEAWKKEHFRKSA
jgi:hypothetical protein